MSFFWINQSIRIIALILIQYGGGLLVRYKAVKVNYTRKFSFFAHAFSALWLNRSIAYEQSDLPFVIEMFTTLGLLIIYIKPIRKRIPFINIAFFSLDRPEDRPHTLLWFSTQIIAVYLLLMPILMIFYKYNLLDFIFVPFLAATIGDGLAEPIGVRWGKHKYTTSALFTQKKYVRSLEGSACIFIISIIVIVFARLQFTTTQFILTLCLLPPLLTVVEAFSPHTWDGPFLYFTSYLTLFIILTGGKIMNELGVFLIFFGLGLFIALPIWAYWSQKAKIEVEKEKTRQLQLKLQLQEKNSKG